MYKDGMYKEGLCINEQNKEGGNHWTGEKHDKSGPEGKKKSSSMPLFS